MKTVCFGVVVATALRLLRPLGSPGWAVPTRESGKPTGLRRTAPAGLVLKQPEQDHPKQAVVAKRTQRAACEIARLWVRATGSWVDRNRRKRLGLFSFRIGSVEW